MSDGKTRKKTWKLDDLKDTRGYLKLKKRSTRSHSVENSLWWRHVVRPTTER